LAEARNVAREWLELIIAGVDTAPHPEPKVDVPCEPRGAPICEHEMLFSHACEEFYQKHVLRQGLRSASEIRRIMDKELLPRWSDRLFVDVRRRDIAMMLDEIEERAPVQADRVLAVLSKMCNWQAARSDEYVSPVVRGMRRSDPNASKRTRILDDWETALLWKASANQPIFGKFVRFPLLTGQRRSKVQMLDWSQIDEDGLWHLPYLKKEKPNAERLPLPDFALNVLGEDWRQFNQGLVFTEDGLKPINGFSKCKARLDADMAAMSDVPISPWVIHDLRRTAKSMMAKCGVARDISERVLGHTIDGVEGVYDQYDYVLEKRVALEKLSAAISVIVH
jgi:integrase